MRGSWLRLAGLVLVLLRLSAASVIGFDGAFTSASAPFGVTECDAACTSPGSVAFQLKLVRSNGLSATDTVYVSTQPPSDASLLAATAGDDYSPLDHVPVVFAPFETTKTVVVTVMSDGVYEEDEYFQAVIASPSAGVSLNPSTQTAYIKIKDGGDAGIFAFSAATYTFPENAGAVQVKVVRAGGASGTVKVTYRLANPAQSTAVNTKNFLLTDSVYQLTFVENQREAFIPFKIINDALYESKEFFYLELSALWPMKASDSSTSIAKYGATRTAAIFIADDGDAGRFDFATPFIFCREDNGSAVVSIVRSLGSIGSYTPVTLSVTTVGSSGGSNATEGGSMAFDYVATSNKLTWTNGETRKTFSVKIFNNKKYEPLTRAFKIRMTAVEGGATIGPQSEIWVYIVDDRDAGTLSFKQASYEVLENAGSITVEVVRGGLSDSTGVNTYSSGTVAVDVATYAGTILPGLDKYDDAQYDNGVVQARRCTHVSPCTATESVGYTAFASTTLTFADGEISKSVTIQILDDTLYEAPDQVFKVVLQNAVGGAHIGIDYEHPGEWFGYRSELLALDKRKNELLDSVGTIVTIKDDGDPAVLVSKASLSLSEIGQTDAFDVWLNSIPTADVTVSLTFDADTLTLTPSTLTFTTSNAAARQTVLAKAVDNNRTQGLPRSDIQLMVTSTDAAYNAPQRTTLAAPTGFVVAANIYTQKPGVYDTGNALHAFPWKEHSGVLTSPLVSASIAVFILDNDPAGVLLSPESLRHRSGDTTWKPTNHIAVRRDGHSATIRVALSTEPAGAVDVALIPAINSGINISPPSLQFSSADWNSEQEVEISASQSSDTTIEERVTFSIVQLVVTSSADSFYNSPQVPVAIVNVQRYPPALVQLDSSVITARENDGDASVSYDIKLGSEPMHWEVDGSRKYIPFSMTLSPVADTTLTFSEDSVTAVAASGAVSTLSAASNSSSSSVTSHLTRIGVMRFTVRPTISSASGSHQVGAAKLRLYRISGGENGGLGGIQVGVAVAEGSIASTWDEGTLRAVCTTGSGSSVECGLRQGSSSTALPLSSLLPSSTPFMSTKSASVGETSVGVSGSFDSVANAYIPAAGWIEIDVTVALNAFLAKQNRQELASQAVENDLTLLIYTSAPSSFVYDGVSEVSFASREYKDSSLRPQLRVLASGRVNLATASSTRVSQSHSGTPKAAVDGKTTSKLGISSSFAMSSTVHKYPWWEADLGAKRLIDDIVITVKRKVSPATTSDSQLVVSFWLMLSDTSLATNNNGLAGLTAARANALHSKRFEISTRSFGASENDVIVLRWRVFGEQGDALFTEDQFRPNYTVTVEAQYLLLQVDGENNIALNEVEIYQPALASARVQLGGFMPSPSVVRKGKNQFAWRLNQPGEQDDDTQCDSMTAVCRRELLFTSGDWWKAQSITARVIDDAVTSGNRDILLTHTLQSSDPSFVGGSVCDSATPDQCRPSLFSSSGVKTLRVLDDDENVVLFSASQLEVEEGSGVYPNAPAIRRERQVFPASVRCSSEPTTVIGVSALQGASCGSMFSKNSPVDGWEVCISDPNAKSMSTGSAWVMAGFPTNDMTITRLILTIPRMRSVKYVRELSLYWSNSLDVNASDVRTLLDVSSSWSQIDSFKIKMTSSGSQTIDVDSLALVSPRLILVSFDKTYDDATSCLLAPSVSVFAQVSMPFPLPVRGDLTAEDSVSPAESGRSRMHQFGRVAELSVRLASEPLKDVLVSAVVEAKNDALSVYDAKNQPTSANAVDLLGGSYESSERVTFRSATALRFTPQTWNTPQSLTFLAVDDNNFNGNRSFTIRHQAVSEDSTATAIPVQTLNGGQITRSFSTVDTPLTYGKAVFVVSQMRSRIWPARWTPQWSSSTGSIQVTVVDDDLPGVTISQSTVIVSESASGPGNYSVALDSAPTSTVVVSVTYTADASLLTVSPLQLTFTSTNWKTPQFVFIQPVANSIYDAGAPLTIDYDRFVAKSSQPLLKHSVASSGDSVYNGILVGGNEADHKMSYVMQQGVLAVVQDDDTGCPLEFTCANGGVCVNVTYGGSLAVSSASVCRCPTTFGMRSCVAQCANARDCAFSRVEMRLKCRTGDSAAICGDKFHPARLVSTLYRMLTTQAFTSSSGITYGKLTLLPPADVMYIANATEAPCVEAGATKCVSVMMDFHKEAGTAANPIVDKLQGYLESGTLQTQPVYAEFMSSTQQYPQSIGATVAVWVFLGFCLASVGGVAVLFALRFHKLRKLHVRPDLHAEGVDGVGETSALTGVASGHTHAH